MDKAARIHAFYILLILGSVIVTFVVIDWGPIKDLANLVSFAATVTSLLLAVIAIVYSFVYNTRAAEATGELKVASDGIGKSATAVQESAADLRARLEQLPNLFVPLNRQLDA